MENKNTKHYRIIKKELHFIKNKIIAFQYYKKSALLHKTYCSLIITKLHNDIDFEKLYAQYKSTASGYGRVHERFVNILKNKDTTDA